MKGRGLAEEDTLVADRVPQEEMICLSHRRGSMAGEMKVRRTLVGVEAEAEAWATVAMAWAEGEVLELPVRASALDVDRDHDEGGNGKGVSMNWTLLMRQLFVGQTDAALHVAVCAVLVVLK